MSLKSSRFSPAKSGEALGLFPVVLCFHSSSVERFDVQVCHPPAASTAFQQRLDTISAWIINFQANAPTIRVKYIPIQGRMSIGEKRNIGVEHTTNDIVLFMDDDDHYPPTSFRRRVSWLLKGRRGDTIGADVAVCTSIAMYDLQRGVSAVNVPPWNIPLAQRISEATLTFRKSFWEERKFTDTSMAEGEGWITGRESAVLEMTPQHIIVAFTHGANMSSRRVAPVDAKVGCFWGFPKEYLLFIHKLVGVDIVEDTK